MIDMLLENTNLDACSIFKSYSMVNIQNLYSKYLHLKQLYHEQYVH